jgi:Trk K+ transport system NAD-binding subunit
MIGPRAGVRIRRRGARSAFGLMSDGYGMRQRFIMTGNSRLTVEVARRLARLDGTVVVLDIEGDGAITRRLRLHQSPLDRRDHTIVEEPGETPLAQQILVVTAGNDLRESLASADLSSATCLLALADDDEENLLVALAGGEVAPEVPVVLQTFDEALADVLEQVDRDVQVRRAYSVGGLSAPFFVALALGDENIRTMRFGDVAIPILRTRVRKDSPLIGMDPARIRATYDCEAIAIARGDSSWDVIEDDAQPISAGEVLLVGGAQTSVFTLACANSSRFRRATRRRRRRFLRRLLPRRPFLRTLSRLPQRRMHAKRLLFPTIPVVLAIALAAGVTTVALHEMLHFDQAMYVLVMTLLGRAAPDPNGGFDTVIAIGGLVGGWALAGLAISFLTAIFVVDRLEESMTVRAKRYANHAIVGGLGTVGYRVWELLHTLDVPCVVIDAAPEREFFEAVGVHDPVLSGGISLTHTLVRANLDHAICLIATSENNIANVEGCMRARRVNPAIRTVARVFDDALAERAGEAFGIDRVIAAVEVAAAAFVDAARDPLALRPFSLNGFEFKGLRHRVPNTLSAQAIRDQGLRILAFRRMGEMNVQHPSTLVAPLEAGDAVVVVGRADSIDAFIADQALDPRAVPGVRSRAPDQAASQGSR